ncbi:MAG TPA: hypothetical protein PLD99_00860 [Parcubacteria group bacterium]|nr:hypothetical protein [Parcubacteria group bacterium]
MNVDKQTVQKQIYRGGRTHFDIGKLPAKIKTLTVLLGYLKFIFGVLKSIEGYKLSDRLKYLVDESNKRLAILAKKSISLQPISEADIMKEIRFVKDAIFAYYESFEGFMRSATVRFSGELEKMRKQNPEIVDRFSGQLADLQRVFRDKLENEKVSYDDLVSAHNAVDLLLDEISLEIEEAETARVLKENEAEARELLEALQAA